MSKLSRSIFVYILLIYIVAQCVIIVKSFICQMGNQYLHFSRVFAHISNTRLFYQNRTYFFLSLMKGFLMLWSWFKVSSNSIIFFTSDFYTRFAKILSLFRL